MKNQLNAVAIIGLVLGGVLGMAGTMVSAANVRATCWAIDAVGVIVAAAILALRFFRDGNDSVAAGFLIYCIGEGVMLAGTPMSLEASVPAFAAGTALWSAGLFLVSVPKGFALWTRATGVIAGILFAIVALRIFWGEQVTPIAHPLPYFAYPFLVLTFAGWIWWLVRAK